MISPPTKRKGSGPLILVVDGSASVRANLSVLLIGAGYRVLQASEGARAASLAATRQCDLVLLEMELPDMCGLQLCHLVRARSELVQLPMVFMSRRPEGNLLRLLNGLAHARFLPMPAIADVILSTLRAALREPRASHVIGA